MRALRRGDFVTLIGHTTIDGMVTLASENGRSLAVMFDGMFWPSDKGGYVGFVPVLQDDAGVFRDLVHGDPITIRLKDRDAS